MHELSVAILSSGSCGNSFLVSNPRTKILVDAGLSCRELERRLGLFGADASEIDAVMLTHEHTDHIRGLRRFCLENGAPVFGTIGTLSLSSTNGLSTRSIRPEERISVGDLTMKAFRVNHFAADPVAFTILDGRWQIGLASDLGCITPALVRELKGSHLLLIEANYDDTLLAKGSYPPFLKEAIRSDHGHLSNDDAGSLAVEAAAANTEGVVLIHLSKENNTPERAERAVGGRLVKKKSTAQLSVAEHGKPCGPFRLR